MSGTHSFSAHLALKRLLDQSVFERVPSLQHMVGAVHDEWGLATLSSR